MAIWQHEVRQLIDYFDNETYVQRLTEALAEAGRRGWELVSMQSSGPQTLADLLVFKRQQEGGEYR